MEPSALGKLLSPAGWSLLTALPPYDEHTVMALSERLRSQGIDGELVAAALTQSRLQAAAQAKFGSFADGMLFTRPGLEQATRWEVAALHASRYLTAGVHCVADLTCGIGTDAMAFAGVGLAVVATDIDEVTAAIATVNLRHFPEAEVRHGDGLALDLSAAGIDGLYADPARRTRSGTRLMDPRTYAPPLDALVRLRDQVPALGIKIGPSVAHRELPEDAEAQWVSVDGDVVEAGLWFGPLAPHGPGRTAMVLRHVTEGDSTRTVSRSLGVEASPIVSPPPVGGAGQYLYEPDGAVIRAGLVAQAAAELDGWLLDPTIAYVTTDTLTPPDPCGLARGIATGYRVVDVFPFNVKRLRSYLRARGVGRATIKKRGTAVTPEQLRKQLSLCGDQEATIVLTRIGGAQHVLVVEPLQTI